MKIALVALLTYLSLVSSGCSGKREPEPIVIHLFRDPAVTEIDSALLTIGTKQLRTSNGQVILIATFEPKSYAEGLETLGNQTHPELVIFDSPEDGRKTKVEIPPQSVVQVGTKQFYLVIPSWVPGEERQTAELVLAQLRKELQRTAQPTAAGASNDACDLPKDLQREIASKYPGRTLVSLSDLGEDAKQLFQKEHADNCPGLVKVDFYGDGKPTLALALTTKSVAKGKTELVVAHQVGTDWITTTLETTDGSAPVVWSEKPGEYKDVYGEKKIRATRPVIIFCGYYSWAVLYAWTNNRVAKIWLAD